MLRKVLNSIPVNLTLIPKFNYNQAKGGMTEPALFQNNNGITRKHASEVMEVFSSKIKWKKHQAKILDVGSGDGGVTCDVVKSYIPRNFEKLVGIDMSPEMVKHANQHYKEDRVEFKLMDITAITADLREQFDHIFSFFTLNWVQEKDQKKALSNIYSMLVPGGDCVFIIIAYNPVFDAFRILAKKPEWSEYTYDAETYISPYHDSQKPEEDFTKLMKECGFSHVDVRRKDSFFEYEDLDAMKRLLASVNAFVHRMSPTVRESFLDDYMKELRILMESVYASRSDHKRAKFETFFTLLYVCGAK